MTNAKREKIIAAMSSLLEQITKNDSSKAKPQTAASETVRMLIVKECTLKRNKLNQNRLKFI